MAQYARFEFTRLDAAGNPISGATIALRKQGATVQSGGPTSFTVDDPGGIIAGDSANVYNADGTDPVSASRSVNSITASNVTVAAGGFSASNNDRISPSTNGPSTYKDAEANEASGALTTDANGYVAAWVEYAPYDVVSTGGTSALGAAPTHVWFDVFPGGQGRASYNDFMSGTTVVRRFNTLRALTSGDKFYSWLSNSVEKWYVGLNAGLGPVVPAHNVAGLLTVDSGGITVTSGTITLPAGALSTAMLAANAIHPAPTTTLGGSGSVVITTSEVVRITTSYTPTAGNVGVLVTVNIPYDQTAVSAVNRMEARLYIGGVLKTRGFFQFASVTSLLTISFVWFEPTMAASATTFEVRDIKIAGTETYNYRGDIFQGYMTIVELKK